MGSFDMGENFYWMNYKRDLRNWAIVIAIVLLLGAGLAASYYNLKAKETGFENGLSELSDALVSSIENKVESGARVAITVFLNDKQKRTPLSEEIVFELESNLSKQNNIKLCNRNSLDQALSEFKFQLDDFVDDESVIKIGKWLGAGYIIFGSYSGWEDSVKIKLKCLEIKGGTTVYADTVLIDKSSIPDSLIPSSGTKYKGAKSNFLQAYLLMVIISILLVIFRISDMFDKSLIVSCGIFVMVNIYAVSSINIYLISFLWQSLFLYALTFGSALFFLYDPFFWHDPYDGTLFLIISASIIGPGFIYYIIRPVINLYEFFPIY